MKREIIITADGSATIHIPEWNEQYHSKHGAIQEAYHVFIKHGLHYINHLNASDFVQKSINENMQNELSILEIGFGTGLNALITYIESSKVKIPVNYVGVEGYPVSSDEVTKLNYAEALHVETSFFNELHALTWEKAHQISNTFTLTKQEKFFDDIDCENKFNLIYFDAFGARVQPELWTESIFKKMYIALKNEGVLVTYAAKGSVRRAMQAVGFLVEKLPGPPGKREMLRATKHVISSV